MKTALEKLAVRAVNYHTNEEAGHIRCAFSVLLMGAVGIPAVIFTLMHFWS